VQRPLEQQQQEQMQQQQLQQLGGSELQQHQQRHQQQSDVAEFGSPASARKRVRSDESHRSHPVLPAPVPLGAEDVGGVFLDLSHDGFSPPSSPRKPRLSVSVSSAVRHAYAQVKSPSSSDVEFSTRTSPSHLSAASTAAGRTDAEEEEQDSQSMQQEPEDAAAPAQLRHGKEADQQADAPALVPLAPQSGQSESGAAIILSSVAPVPAASSVVLQSASYVLTTQSDLGKAGSFAPMGGSLPTYHRLLTGGEIQNQTMAQT